MPTGRLSILALVTEAYGGRGGIAQYNRDLLMSLEKSDTRFDIEVLPRFAPDTTDDMPTGITQRRPKSGKLGYAIQALRVALSRRPEIIFCGHLYMAPLCALIARASGARLVIQLHGIEIWSPPSHSQREAIDKAELILCVSRYTRFKVLEFSGVSPQCVRVHANTFSPEYAPGDREAARQRFGLTPEQFCVLTVGRLDARERYKGQDRIIAALPDLISTNPSIVYLISGEGDDRTRLEQLALDLGVQDSVRFLGHVPRNAMADLYRAADLFALPSTGEGFGIVFLEAMACGTPAIGLGVAGANDALVDGALGAAPSDAAFPNQLMDMVRETKRDDEGLSGAVNQRFGRTIFEARAQALFATLNKRPR